MNSTLSNTLKDTIGIVRAVSYRTFVAKDWKSYQPMFNILTVKEGEEPLFEAFLKKSLGISLQYDTPLSLGPYKNPETRTYIYITHYASTKAYLQVMQGLLFKGAAAMRAKATLNTSWTYCKPTDSNALKEVDQIIMVGIQGDTSPLQAFMNKKHIQPIATVERVKDVRGHSLGTYLFFHDTAANRVLLEQFIIQGGDIKLYPAVHLS